jgi:hypothetical protein
VSTCSARTSRHTAQGSDSIRHTINYIGNMILHTVALAVLLVISGVEQNLELVWRLRALCKYCEVGVTGA